MPRALSQWDESELRGRDMRAFRAMEFMSHRPEQDQRDERPQKYGKSGGKSGRGAYGSREHQVAYHTGRCFSCDEYGHRATDCPRREEQFRRAP